MATAPAFEQPAVPLSRRPQIVHAGMGEHHGPASETFRFANLWQLHLYFWKGGFEIRRRRFSVNPEMVSLLPPGPRVTWHFAKGKCDHYFIHFRLPGKQRKVLIPTVSHVQSHYELISRLIYGIVTDHGGDPFAAEIRLWAVLFQLAELHASREFDAAPGAVETAQTLMDSELAGGINFAQVAKRVGYSRSHLTRLFREYTGQSPGAYLTGQRVALAKELLEHSNLTIGQVGRRVGIPDANRFNKFIRRKLRMSPKDVRRRGSPRMG